MSLLALNAALYVCPMCIEPVFACITTLTMTHLISGCVLAAVQRNLVLRFKDDTIDDSLQLAQLLQNRWGSSANLHILHMHCHGSSLVIFNAKAKLAPVHVVQDIWLSFCGVTC